jgi:hypothetical protein
MTYDQLLATLPMYEEDEYCNCITCEKEGCCDQRARALTGEVVAQLMASYSHEATEYNVLYWLLDNGEVGTDRNEDAEELAQMYFEANKP